MAELPPPITATRLPTATRAVDVVRLEERERLGDALAVFAGHADVGALRGADAEEHGLVALVLAGSAA